MTIPFIDLQAQRLRLNGAIEAARRAGVPGFRFEGGNLDQFVKELLGH